MSLSAPPRSAHQSQPRILVVDDVPEQSEAYGTMLDGKGIDLRFVTSGALALRSATVTRPDIVLLDVALPDMDGYEVARRLRATDGLSELPVILVTARAHPEDVLNGFSAGGVDYMTKPFNAAAQQMAKSLHDLLEWARPQRGGIEFSPEAFPLVSVVEESLLQT